MKTNPRIQLSALFVIAVGLVSFSFGASRPPASQMVEALQAARTLVDGYQVTGISDRNRPGIMLDRKRFVEVGKPLKTDGKTLLLFIDSDYTAKPGAPRWRLTFERDGKERFVVVFPKTQSAQTRE